MGPGQSFVHDLLNMSSKTLRCLNLDTEKFVETPELDDTRATHFPHLMHVSLRRTQVDTSTTMSLYHPSSVPALKSLELSLYDYNFLVDFTIPTLTLVTITNWGQALVDTPSYSFSIFMQHNPQISHVNVIITEGRHIKHSHLATHFILPIKGSSLHSLSMVGHPDLLSSNMLRELSEITTLKQLRLRVVLPSRTEDLPIPTPLRVNHITTRDELATLQDLEILIIDGDICNDLAWIASTLKTKLVDELVATAYQYAYTFPNLRVLVIDYALFRIAVRDDGERHVVEIIIDRKEVTAAPGLLKKEFRFEEHMYGNGR